MKVLESHKLLLGPQGSKVILPEMSSFCFFLMEVCMLVEWPAGVIYRKYIVGTWSELVSEECSHFSLSFAMSIKKLNCNYYVDCWIYSVHFLSILNYIFILRGSRHRELLVLMKKTKLLIYLYHFDYFVVGEHEFNIVKLLNVFA